MNEFDDHQFDLVTECEHCSEMVRCDTATFDVQSWAASRSRSTSCWTAAAAAKHPQLTRRAAATRASLECQQVRATRTSSYPATRRSANSYTAYSHASASPQSMHSPLKVRSHDTQPTARPHSYVSFTAHELNWSSRTPV